MSWLGGPIAGLDFEATGTNVETDRIVTGSVYIRDYGCRSWLIRPGVEIPQAAIAVHGITNEAAEDGMEPAEGIYRIHLEVQSAWAQGAPIVAHNAPYDLTLLDRELRRHLGRPLEINGPVIDTLTLDKAVDPYRKGSRRLKDACVHWGVNVQEDAWHTSNGDVMAAVRLAWTIGNRGELPYQGALAELDLRALHALQVEAYAQQRASFNSWLRGQGRVPDDENTVWPLKPYGKVE